jgi:hypothetical protein
MPLTYQIDPQEGIVTIAGDYAEAAEWRALLGSIASDPAFRRGLGFIRDLRASAHPVSAEAVIQIIDVVKEHWERMGVRRAAIVTRRGVDMPAMIAHALAETDHLALRAFTDYEDALEWLRASA